MHLWGINCGHVVLLRLEKSDRVIGTLSLTTGFHKIPENS